MTIPDYLVKAARERYGSDVAALVKERIEKWEVEKLPEDKCDILSMAAATAPGKPKRKIPGSGAEPQRYYCCTLQKEKWYDPSGDL